MKQEHGACMSIPSSGEGVRTQYRSNDCFLKVIAVPPWFISDLNTHKIFTRTGTRLDGKGQMKVKDIHSVRLELH